MPHRKLALVLLLCVACATRADAQSSPKAPSSVQLMQTGFPNVSTISAENAAGLLGYCVKNKYLAAPRASPVLNGLMSKRGLSSSSGYDLGQKGHIISAHRRPMTFMEIPNQLKGQACEAVLKRGSTVMAQRQPAIADRPTSTTKGN